MRKTISIFGTVDEGGDLVKVISYGPERVLNGSFADASEWVLDPDLDIAGGSLNALNAGVPIAAANSGTVLAGKTYKCVFTILNYVSGSVKMVIGAASGTARNANGTYTQEITTLGNSPIYLQTTAGVGTWSIDNVSVKEKITTWIDE